MAGTEKLRNNGMKFQIGLICLMHFVNDIHIAFLPTFVPTIVERLGLSLTQAGLLNSLAGLMNMMGQPFFGHMSDRISTPKHIIVGPILTCLGATLLPLAPNYALALIFVGLWGVGTSIYHPQGSGGIGHLCDGENLASWLSFFGLGGMLAGSLSPIYAVGLFHLVGAKLTPVVALVPVLLGVSAVYFMIPRLGDAFAEGTSKPGFFDSFRSVFGTVWPIWLVAFLRATSGQGIRFFLPLVIAARGGNLATIGMVLFLITVGASVSPIICGRLADCLGARRVLVVILGLLPFFLVPAALTVGVTSKLLYMVGYALLTATEPITNAMAQQRTPEARGMASSIIMGFAFGLGGVVTAPLGALADHFSLQTTMVLLGIIPSLSLPIIFSPLWRR